MGNEHAQFQNVIYYYIYFNCVPTDKQKKKIGILLIILFLLIKYFGSAIHCNN